MTWKHHIERTVAKALRIYLRAYYLLRSVHSIQILNLRFAKLWLDQLWLKPVPPGSNWNCTARRTEYSSLLEIVTDAHQSANWTCLSKFCTCMTLKLSYEGTLEEVILKHVNPNVLGTGKEEATHKKNKRLLNLAAVRPTTVQLTLIDRIYLYILYKCYLVQCSDKWCTESGVTWTSWQRGYTRAETTVQET
jgi:hypothetical protein